ncbi:MAG TPA: response regulator transcription factor [Firmicutes bacterium]|nr:response regulator transcription factor [Bacillota bacterium]
MAKLIAIVDDEPDILELISYHLKKERFEVREFRDGEGLLSFIETMLPDLVILDLMLPGMDGLEVCRVLRGNRRTSSVPIIMLTAKGSEADKVVGLELGADDYVVKPFSPRELVARVKAVLRRAKVEEKGESLVIGDLAIDTNRFEVRFKGRRIDLTPTEFRILAILAERPGWVFTRNQLLNELWQEDKVVLDRTIDVHIRHLREKLGEGGRLIKTVRGIGYKLEVQRWRE